MALRPGGTDSHRPLSDDLLRSNQGWRYVACGIHNPRQALLAECGLRCTVLRVAIGIPQPIVFSLSEEQTSESATPPRRHLMKKYLNAILLASVMTIASTASLPAAAHDAPNRCGHRQALGAGWDQLRGHGVNCLTARGVAERWHDRTMNGQSTREITVADRTWRCSRDRLGSELWRVKCTSNGDIVHTSVGATNPALT